jgi:hypothetical protein
MQKVGKEGAASRTPTANVRVAFTTLANHHQREPGFEQEAAEETEKAICVISVLNHLRTEPDNSDDLIAYPSNPV